mgnify:CR=1 FL=1
MCMMILVTIVIRKTIGIKKAAKKPLFQYDAIELVKITKPNIDI